MSDTLTHRLATEADLPALREVMDLAIGELQKPFLTPAEIEASRGSMGVDTQLVKDRTYFMVTDVATGRLAGCGGWSRRATLYGGDHSTPLRDENLLVPGRDAARIRAMYTHPDFTRRGIGRLILSLGEEAARAEGFLSVELGGTVAGIALYKACGYHVIEETLAPPVNGLRIPIIRMGKSLV